MNVGKSALTVKNWVLMVTANPVWLELSVPKVSIWLVNVVLMVSQLLLRAPPMLVIVRCLFVRWDHTSIRPSTNVNYAPRANTKTNPKKPFANLAQLILLPNLKALNPEMNVPIAVMLERVKWLFAIAMHTVCF
jgi:hypothetical protein